MKFAADKIKRSLINNFSMTELRESVAGDVKWAEHSQFYGQVMADGHIFNPYLHRRWLPSQYVRLRRWGITNFAAAFCIKYQIEWMAEEVNKLYYLSRTDKTAYEERKLFLPAEEVAQVFAELVPETSNDTAMYIMGGRRSRELWYDFKINDLHEKYVNAHTYRDLAMIFAGVKVGRTAEGSVKKLNEVFAKYYPLAGAYYTLKHKIMFENLRLIGAPTASESLEYILDLVKSGKATVEMFNNMMDDNDEDVPLF